VDELFSQGYVQPLRGCKSLFLNMQPIRAGFRVATMQSPLPNSVHSGQKQSQFVLKFCSGTKVELPHQNVLCTS
jgi:hypothetical protein